MTRAILPGIGIFVWLTAVKHFAGFQAGLLCAVTAIAVALIAMRANRCRKCRKIPRKLSEFTPVYPPPTAPWWERLYPRLPKL